MESAFAMLVVLLLFAAMIAGGVAILAATLLRSQGASRSMTAGQQPPSEAPPPYRRKDWLLTRAERDFFHALHIACGEGQHVFAKVRMEDLLWIPKGTEKRQSWRSRVKSRHIDFVVCDLATSRPLVAIELDDASHGRADRRERDAFVDSVFEAAGLRLERFPVSGRGYDIGGIRDRLGDPLPAAPPTATPHLVRARADQTG